MVFINLHTLEDGGFGKTGAFRKQKSRFSRTKLLRWFTVCQEAAVMPDIGTCRIIQATEKAFNRKYVSTEGCPDCMIFS